jgi:phosphatidate cytidylyltransferase
MMTMLKNCDPTWILFAGILALLVLLTILGSILKRLASRKEQLAAVSILNSRIRIWWAMCGIFAVAALTGGLGSILVFGLTSFLLLREFVTITPTRKGDHHALFWIFFIILPLHYYLLWSGWYGMFIILIPVYAFLFVPLRMAMSGDSHGFLERAAKIQWALMICVYCISHAPALLKVEFAEGSRMGLRLLLYLCLIVQANDITQIIWSQGSDEKAGDDNNGRKRHGTTLAAGLLVSTALGAGLWWATPFSAIQSAGMSLLIALMGTAGKHCYRAIMQDRGKPGVVVVETRPSMTERVISLCFAAPVFFHLARYFFTDRPQAPF